MEALRVSTPPLSHAELLSSTELRVPKHDPGNFVSQPRESCLAESDEPSVEKVITLPSTSTEQTTSVDSAYGSVHAQDSQKATSGIIRSTQSGKQQKEVEVEQVNIAITPIAEPEHATERTADLSASAEKTSVAAESGHGGTVGPLPVKSTPQGSVLGPNTGSEEIEAVIEPNTSSQSFTRANETAGPSGPSLQHLQHDKNDRETDPASKTQVVSEDGDSIRTRTKPNRFMFWKRFRASRTRDSIKEQSTKKVQEKAIRRQSQTHHHDQVLAYMALPYSSNFSPTEEVKANTPDTVQARKGLIQNSAVSKQVGGSASKQPIQDTHERESTDGPSHSGHGMKQGNTYSAPSLTSKPGPSNKIDNPQPASLPGCEDAVVLSKCSPQKGKTAITDTTVSEPGPSGHFLFVPVNSLYPVEGDLYVGRLRDFPPPLAVERTWLTTIRNRLITDLRPVLASLSRSLALGGTTVELELCMAARNPAGSPTVPLWPMIWVRCGSKQCRKVVRRALEDLSYLHAFPFHVSLEAPRFASRSSRAMSSVPTHAHRLQTRDSIPNPAIIGGAVGGGVIFFFVGLFALLFWWRKRRAMHRALQYDERPPDMFEIERNPPYRVKKARISELDGSTMYSGKKYPVVPGELLSSDSAHSRFQSSQERGAHELAELPTPLLRPTLQSKRGERDSTMSTGAKTPRHESRWTEKIKSICGMRVSFENFDLSCTIGGVIRVGNEIYGLTTAHGIWVDAVEHHNDQSICEICDIMGKDIQLERSTPHTWPWTTVSIEKSAYPKLCRPCIHSKTCEAKEMEGADFALLKLDGAMIPINSYTVRGMHNIIRGTDAIETGSVSILCSEFDVRPGELLRGSSLFMDRSGVWETQKIECNHPLEIGSSGTWVVQGDRLLGVVVATYDRIPYVHMLPIRKVFDDIRSVVAGDGDPLEVRISLPDALAADLEEDQMEFLQDHVRGPSDNSESTALATVTPEELAQWALDDDINPIRPLSAVQPKTAELDDSAKAFAYGFVRPSDPDDL